MVLTAERILKRTCMSVPLPEAPLVAAAEKATAPGFVVTLQMNWAPRMLILSPEISWMPSNSSAALSYSSTNCRESMVWFSLGGSTTTLRVTATVSPTLPRTSSEVMTTGAVAADAKVQGISSSTANSTEKILRFIRYSFMSMRCAACDRRAWHCLAFIYVCIVLSFLA